MDSMLNGETIKKNCEPKTFLGKLRSRGSYHTKCDVLRITR